MKKHNEIVMENVPFVRSALKLIALNKTMKGPRLLNIDDDILLLKDKQFKMDNTRIILTDRKLHN